MKNHLLHTHRPAFTLIEVIISVVIISGVILSVMEISSRSTDSALYLSKRASISFQDSLYLTDEITKHHKKTKNAYEHLNKHFNIKEDESKEILQNISREIMITKSIKIPSLEQVLSKAEIEKAVLKDKYTSSYYRFKLEGIQ